MKTALLALAFNLVTVQAMYEEYSLATETLKANTRTCDEFRKGCGNSCQGNTYNNCEPKVCLCTDDQWTSKMCDPLMNDFLPELYRRTNELRAVHGAGPLTEDSHAASTAQAWADKLAAHYDRYGERPSEMHGDLQGWTQSVLTQGGRAEGAASADAWYEEQNDYSNYVGFGREPSQSSQQYYKQWGHFAVLVWKAYTKVGCGRAFYKKYGLRKGSFVVCHYGPGTEASGKYADNIQQGRSRAPTNNFSPETDSSRLDCNHDGSTGGHTGHSAGGSGSGGSSSSGSASSGNAGGSSCNVFSECRQYCRDHAAAGGKYTSTNCRHGSCVCHVDQ